MSKFRCLTFLLLLCFAETTVGATTRAWPVNTVTFVVSDLSDFHDQFKDAFREASDRWNDSATSFRIVTTPGNGIGYCGATGNNSVRFADNICGTEFGANTLAVASSWFNGNEISKVDITFNSAKRFSVFDGNRFDAVDFRRVAIHELGHAMGLPHLPSSDAIMFFRYTNNIVPGFDDVEALRDLYGSLTHDLQLSVRGPGVIRVLPKQNGTGVLLDSTFRTNSLGSFLDCLQPNCLLNLQDGLRLRLIAEPSVGGVFAGWEGTELTGPNIVLSPLFSDRALTAVFSEDGSEPEPDFTVDSDGDGVPDLSDPFPLDPRESRDRDGDGIGDNTDLDDDQDGISDLDEVRFGFDPLDPTDANGDFDGDGVTNRDEINRGTDPRTFNGVRSERNGILEFKYAWYETAENQSSAVISVHRINGRVGPVSVNYSTFNTGSARAGRDHKATSGTLSWTSTEVGAKSFRVPLVGDGTPEGSHHIGLKLSSPTNGAELGLSEAVLVVRDDDFSGDGKPLHGIVSTNRFGAVNEVMSRLFFDVGRFRGSEGAVLVTVTAEPITASAGEDYRFSSTVLSWEDGETGWKQVSIPIINDDLIEGVESFRLRLSGLGGIFIPDDSDVIIDIVDDEIPTNQAYRFARSRLFAHESLGLASNHIIRDLSESGGQLFISAFEDSGTSDDFLPTTDSFVWAEQALVRQFMLSLTDDSFDESFNSDDTETLFIAAATDSAFDDVVAVARIGILDQEDVNGDVDTDADGLVDFADIDDDNDSVRDWRDAFPKDPEEYLDSDNDGIGNNGDLDDDADGVRDLDDVFPLDGTLSSCPSDLTGSHRVSFAEFVRIPIWRTCLRDEGGNVTGIPISATAVTLNVTAVSPAAGGFVTVWPCSNRPEASSLNYVSGDIVPNGVIAPIGKNGDVCVFSNSETDLVVDVAGWFEGDAFLGTIPTRMLDTRNGLGGRIAPIDAGEVLPLSVFNFGARSREGTFVRPPKNLSAVSLNVTVVNPVGDGFLTVFPCDTTRPNSSNLNFVEGDTVANGVIATVSEGGHFCLYSSQQTHVLVDFSGWFSNVYRGVGPYRLVDTRFGIGAPMAKISPASIFRMSIHGTEVTVNGSATSIPMEASAVALNVTAVNPEGGGFMTIWPCGTPRPNASNLNFLGGQTIPNNVIAPLGENGEVCFFSSQKSDIVVDMAGYFVEAEDNRFVGVTPKRYLDTREGIGPAVAP